MVAKKISLNLASNPLRNRRLFYLLIGSAGIIFLVVIFLAGEIFLTYRLKTAKVKASITKLEEEIRAAQRKGREFTTNIKDEAKRFKGEVDFINGVILRKSFSWLSFLGDLENSLPDSSYIVSLAPKLIEDSSMEVRFKVVSQNLNDLLKLINNLRALKFNKIRVESEAKDEAGSVISEISLRYERNI